MRKSYTFDENPFRSCNADSYRLFAHAGEQFFYLEGGNNSGCRVLVEIAPDAEEPRFSPVAAGAGLHASETVKLLEPAGLLRALRVAADNGNVGALLDIWEVPGFEEARPLPERRERGDRRRRSELPAPARTHEGFAIHSDGWFTRSRFTIQLPAPAWAPDARAFDLREGIYLAFEDGTFRLVPKPEYFDFRDDSELIWGVPDARQGDLLLYARPEVAAVEGEAEFSQSQNYDRHRVSGWEVEGLQDTWAWPTITHPEHEGLRLEGVFRVVLAPGVSRPFSAGGGRD